MVYQESQSKFGTSAGVFLRDADKHTIGILRIVIGFIWLWAFLDKMFGLGFSTTSANAWINGGSPITGYLKFGTNPNGPFFTFFSVDLVKYADILSFLLMGMFLFVGLSMIFGIMIRLGSLSAIVFLVSVYLSELPLTTNPIIDEHVIYGLIFLFFIIAPVAGQYIGFGKKWQELDIVKKYPILK